MSDAEALEYIRAEHQRAVRERDVYEKARNANAVAAAKKADALALAADALGRAVKAMESEPNLFTRGTT